MRGVRERRNESMFYASACRLSKFHGEMRLVKWSKFGNDMFSPEPKMRKGKDNC